MSEYPAHYVDRLEILWGRGFMSPGGPDEVREIVKGIDLADKHVLDIGCGIGGPDLVLCELGAAHVTGIDVDDALIERARNNAAAAGVAERTAFMRVSPGPLNFPDESLDLVFSKDAILHVDDKAAMFAEIFRILKPGGHFAASDWLCGEGSENTPEWRAYAEQASYTVVAVTAAEVNRVIAEAGFTGIETRDRNRWYAELSRKHMAQIEGELRDELIRASSPEIYERWRKARRAQLAAVEAGAMRPTHLRAIRP